jgi:glycosyltransferase involved in cell wall biosynthesis
MMGNKEFNNLGRILFLDTFTDPTFRSVSSPEIGFGISSSKALKRGLAKLGLEIIECSLPIQTKPDKLSWIYNCYDYLHRISPAKNDIVFIFHPLIHFPGEVRRLVNHHTKIGCPILGYAHGSHWDPTDTIRAASNPKLLFQDLANLLTCDYLLLVSEYYKKLLREELFALGPTIIDRYDKIVRVVGLPIDDDSIDKCRSLKNSKRNVIQLLFNHALRPPKRPELALFIIDKVLEKFDNCIVDITRSFEPKTILESEYLRLSKKFKNRIICHGTLPLDEYYELLWKSDIQFSTASHESLGVATIEAMYTENACFTPNCLSYPEVTGGIGNYNSLEELLELIEKAILNADFRKEISKQQKQMASKYSSERIATTINHVIEQFE